MFIKQKNEYGCGPVAIINAISWVRGSTFSYKNYKKIEKMCRTDPDGTEDKYFIETLKEYGEIYDFTVRRVRWEDIGLYEVICMRDRAVLISHPDDDDYHWSFMCKYEFDMPGIIIANRNGIEGLASIPMGYEEARSYIDERVTDKKEKPVVFIIERK